MAGVPPVCRPGRVQPLGMSKGVIRIATRGSALALAQANIVLEQCRKLFPRRDFEIVVIKTTGDKLQTASLAESNLPKGLFTKELELALSNREADMAVHSLKDLPTELPSGLEVGAVLEREDVRDVLICRRDALPKPSLRSLPKSATIATSSTRRAAQLRELRPDIRVAPIRGNVPTRLRKLARQTEIDGIILAAAGLARLLIGIAADGLLTGPEELVTPGLSAALIPLEEMLPCVGQAAIGIEVREDDPITAPLCVALNHAGTYDCVMAERAFLRGMGGGCQLAVAAHATRKDGLLYMKTVSFLRGPASRAEGHGSSPEDLGRALASKLT